MMRVFWDEWRSGSLALVRKGLPGLALVEGVVLVLSHFVPGFFFEVLAGGFVLGGLASGTNRWNTVQSWDWVGLQAVSPLAYALGKISALLFLGLVTLAFLLPPLVLIMALWAMPVAFVLFCLVWVLVGGLAAQALSQLVCWNEAFFSRPIGASLVVAWLGITAAFRELQMFNPLWQIWRLHRDVTAEPGWGALAAVVGGTFLIWALIAVILTRVKESTRAS